MFKRSIFVTALLLPSFCMAGLQLTFTNRKSAHQSGPKTLSYTGGDFEVIFQDGSWELADCAVAPSLTIVEPNPLCEEGTTAYVIEGDLDHNSVVDDGSYWSLAAKPRPSLLAAPFRPDGFKVESAPASRFPRPEIYPVYDGSVMIMYNMLTDELHQYEIARYAHRRTFAAGPAGRRNHDLTVESGVYRFSFLGKETGNGYGRHVVSINSMPMPEAYPGLEQSPLKWGFRFTNDSWNESGQLQFDPRLINYITWEGINDSSGANVFRSVDTMRLWFTRAPMDSPLHFPETEGADPNHTFPPAGRTVLLPDPTVTRYRLPVRYFAAGGTARLYLRLDRDHSVGVSTDKSARVWSVDLAFVDTYTGFSLFGGKFPPGTPASQRDPYFDFDGDGMSNINEYALGSDPGDPSSVVVVDPVIMDDGSCEVTLNKRANTGTTLSYALEYTHDMVNWIKIEPDDPDWDIIVDDSSELTVRTKQAMPNVTCFVRAHITVNAL